MKVSIHYGMYHRKKWEKLGSLKPVAAANKYIEILDRLSPGWDTSRTFDTALFVEWVPDAAKHTCALCEEGFTFMNRKHHVRTCLVKASTQSTIIVLYLLVPSLFSNRMCTVFF